MPARQRDKVFDRFVREAEPQLRRALVAAYGHAVGRDATVDALAWAWTNWERIEEMANPIGYLYRVGQTSAGRQHRPQPVPSHVEPATRAGMPWVEPDLEPALQSLSEHQRVAVVLCHGFGWTHREVAELLELSPSSVQNHVERAVAHLRRALHVAEGDA